MNSRDHFNRSGDGKGGNAARPQQKYSRFRSDRPHHGNRFSQSSKNRSNRPGDRFRPKEKENPYLGLNYYFKLIEEHVLSRRKYYDEFSKANKERYSKLKSRFEETGRQLRSYYEKIKGMPTSKLFSSAKEYPEDLDYAKNHGINYPLNTEGQPPPPQTEVEDPHFSKLLKSRPSFKEDNEETQGDLSDYINLKGQLGRPGKKVIKVTKGKMSTE